MATRMQFSRGFKVEAVKLVTERGVGVSQASRDFDMGKTVLRRWMSRSKSLRSQTDEAMETLVRQSFLGSDSA